MATRVRLAILLAGVLLIPALGGCASAPLAEDGAAHGDLYAADGGTPADIYRTWHLYKTLAGNSSVEGELRLADLHQWKYDEYRSAYYWYRKAAYDGDGVAAANLWYMYETRSDRPADNQRALGFYEVAAQSDAGRRQLYALETKVAVDSQRHYPAAARQTGVTLVEFDRDGEGKATDVKVYRSSGDAALDAAAVAAVQDAALPKVPESLRDLHHFVISVRPGPSG